MANSPLNWAIFLFISYICKDIHSVGISKIGLALLNMCILKEIEFIICQPLNKSELLKLQEFDNMKAESLENNSNLKYHFPPVIWPEFHCLNNILPNETKLTEEKHERSKKSIPKKTIPVQEMRYKLKQLLSNISNTFNDMDWYFALEQFENQTPEIGFHRPAKKKIKKLGQKKMNKNDQNSDIFLDQFIQQMYGINPLFIDKIRSKIDEEISSNKRRIRLAFPSLDESEIYSMKTQSIPLKSKVPLRKTIVKSVQVKDLIPSYSNDEDFYFERDRLLRTKEKDSSHLGENEFKSRIFQTDDNYDSLDFDLPIFKTTSTLSTTVKEAFYDNMDYHKETFVENEDMRNIEEYEINKDDRESSGFDVNDYMLNKNGIASIKSKTRKAGLKKGSRFEIRPPKELNRREKLQIDGNNKDNLLELSLVK